MASKLVALRGPLAGESFELADAALTIGRGVDNIVVIASKEASRNHAQIRREGAGYVLVDQGSSNGTFVNGQQTTTHHLSHGDEIAIGDEAFRFEQVPDAPAVRLVALEGPLAGRHFDLDSEGLTFGRSVTSTVVLSSKEVSRNHAQIRREGAGYVLVDQGSSNGTLVNGQPVTTHQLRHGDRIAIGEEVFGFEDAGSTVVPPAVVKRAAPAPARAPEGARPPAPTPPPSVAARPEGPAKPKPARNAPPPPQTRLRHQLPRVQPRDRAAPPALPVGRRLARQRPDGVSRYARRRGQELARLRRIWPRCRSWAKARPSALRRTRARTPLVNGYAGATTALTEGVATPSYARCSHEQGTYSLD